MVKRIIVTTFLFSIILFFSSCDVISVDDLFEQTYESTGLMTETTSFDVDETIAVATKEVDDSNNENSIFVGYTPTPISEIPCDIAYAGDPIDVTITDGTRMQPGEKFTKVWRLVNNGSCSWTREYKVVFYYGDQMSVSEFQYLRSPVLPGESVDISLEMVAPSKAGSYYSYWKLQNAKGELFGIGPMGDSPIWVSVDVFENRTATPTPLPTSTPTPIVLMHDTVYLLLDDSIDFDSGSIDKGAEDDMLFHRNDEGVLELIPSNGARVMVFGETLPKMDDCRAADFEKEPIILEDVQDKNIYFCYYSNRSLPGYARLAIVDLVGDIVGLEFLTWEVP